MTALLTILVIFGILVLLFFLLAILTSKAMVIEKNIVIKRPIEEVYSFLRLAKNHEKFNVWTLMDPQMKKEYRGVDGEPGCVYAWDSTNKSVGAGEQELKRLEANKRIDYELRFIRPMPNKADARFILDSFSPDQTRVIWGFYGQMGFPMNALKSIFVNMLGKQLYQGLENLKKVLES
jgi:hypothetical protein